MNRKCILYFSFSIGFGFGLTNIKFQHSSKPFPLAVIVTDDTTSNKRTTEMKLMIVIFCLTLFTITSCNENKAKTKKVDVVVTSKPTSSNAYSQVKKPNDSQEINLYQLNDLEENTSKKVGFISLSDKYPLSEHNDSLAIPNLDTIKDKKSLQYFNLDTEYRKRFLTKTKISELDSVYIYDYSTNILLSFLIKNLNVAANLSIYRNIDDYPLNQYDYEIGFGIDKKILNGLDKYYSNVLVFVGKENPFVQGQMKPITWKKIDFKEFPSTKSNLSDTSFLHKNSRKGNAYLYNSDKYQYFIQDFTEIQNNAVVVERHLMLIGNKNGKVIIERVFSESDGISIAQLNFGINNPNYLDSKEQWTGKLFKDKPEVTFGFDMVSFGCPNIIFLDPQWKDIYLNCDNRH